MVKVHQGYVISRQELPEPLSSQVIQIQNLQDLPTSGCSFVVINFDDLTPADVLHQLRQKPGYQLLPVFYLGQPPVHHEQILDGKYDELAIKLSESIQSRTELTQYNNKEQLTDFEKLISQYLFVRDKFILKGFLDYHSPSGFQYPLLDVLGFQEDMQHYWYMLQSMETRKFLKHETLVDEIQTCPSCKSGLLNFKNCCPNCSSFHLGTQSFIHCFSCGNVGPLPEFLRQDELICNRCFVKLRHIGIDYDKPMEDKICQDCHHFFFEPTVNAICMVCTQLSDPADLQAKKLFEYRLASRGESLAKGLDQHLVVELGQFLKLIDLSIFMMIIKWQTLLAKRYEELVFSLVAIRVTNEEDLINVHGLSKTEQLLMEFFDRIRSLLRTTDLVSRNNKTILFFLPMTPIEGCKTIYDRIKEFASNQGEQEIIVHGSMMSSTDIIENNIEADLLLTELMNRVDDHD